MLAANLIASKNDTYGSDML